MGDGLMCHYCRRYNCICREPAASSEGQTRPSRHNSVEEAKRFWKDAAQPVASPEGQISHKELAGIAAGLADVAAGRVRPFKEIQQELAAQPAQPEPLEWSNPDLLRCGCRSKCVGHNSVQTAQPEHQQEVWTPPERWGQVNIPGAESNPYVWIPVAELAALKQREAGFIEVINKSNDLILALNKQATEYHQSHAKLVTALRDWLIACDKAESSPDWDLYKTTETLLANAAKLGGKG